MTFTKLDYCQYLLSSPIKYTVTNLADHLDGISHDRINRYLRGEKLTAHLLWDNVRLLLQPCENGYILFDDTVLDKRHSASIELTRRQYSGNEHRVIRGIGLISCVYVNRETGQFWVIDYRLYDPDGDGQSKLDHVAAMLNRVVYSKHLAFTTVLMDSWYATQALMAQIDQLKKVYYCALKSNRRVDDSGGTAPYQRIDELLWSAEGLQQGKLNKIRGFPKDKKVKLFRVTVSTSRTEFVVTNDLTQASTDAVQDVCNVRWKTIGVSPRAKAVDRNRSVSMPQSAHSTRVWRADASVRQHSSQSHCLCLARLDSPQDDRLPDRQNCLPD